MQRVDPEKRQDWEMMLEAPLPGREQKVSPALAEKEGEEFMAMMQMHNQLAGKG